VGILLAMENLSHWKNVKAVVERQVMGKAEEMKIIQTTLY
jgi:hypothetical protein